MFGGTIERMPENGGRASGGSCVKGKGISEGRTRTVHEIETTGKKEKAALREMSLSGRKHRGNKAIMIIKTTMMTDMTR